MEPKVINLPKYSVMIEEQSLTSATATYLANSAPFAELSLTWAAPQGWSADAEWLSTPATEKELLQQEMWEKLQETEVNRAAKFHPPSHSAFEVLDTIYSRRFAASKLRESRHPLSRRGDKTK